MRRLKLIVKLIQKSPSNSPSEERSAPGNPPSSMVHSAGWSFMGQGGRLLMQLAYFAVVAHTLGPKEYGAFVGATALASVFAPFCGVGIGNIVVKNVAR